MKSSKYEQTLKNYDFDSIATRHPHIALPERSMSRSARWSFKSHFRGTENIGPKVFKDHERSFPRAYTNTHSRFRKTKKVARPHIHIWILIISALHRFPSSPATIISGARKVLLLTIHAFRYTLHIVHWIWIRKQHRQLCCFRIFQQSAWWKSYDATPVMERLTWCTVLSSAFCILRCWWLFCLKFWRLGFRRGLFISRGDTFLG